MIAALGGTALAYFLIVDAIFGAGGERGGGVIGANIWWALHALFGDVGAWIVLWLRCSADGVDHQRLHETDDRARHRLLRRS